MSSEALPLPVPASPAADTPGRIGWAIWSTYLVAAMTYAALVLLMWVPYTMNAGMPFETCFPYMSETSPSWWRGFLYSADPLRIHTNTFYHASYLLADLFGIPGSFLTFQIVYAVLWWARGFLVFLILCRFVPTRPLFSFLAGALVLCHGADSALNWVGQLNQFGYLFWMAAGYYSLILAYQAKTPTAVWSFGLTAVFCTHMSLWSYEAQIVILVLLPLLLPLLKEGFTRRFFALAGGWYGMIGLYILHCLKRYFADGVASYQATVLRADFGMPAILSDWWFNISHSLSFWNWSESLGTQVEAGEAMALGALAAAVLFGSGMLIARLCRTTDETAPARVWKYLFILFVGATLLAMSYPVYLLLTSARMNWRTQLLAGGGTAIVVAAAACWTGGLVGRKRMASLVAIGLCLPMVCYGTRAAVRFGAYHGGIWERHRQVVANVVEVAPRLKQDTVVVLLNIPSPQMGRDPFGDRMWLDMALRLAYPETSLACLYFYTDGKPGPGNNLKITGDEWAWDGTSFPPLLRKAKLRQTIVIEYNQGGAPRLVTEWPALLPAGEAGAAQYAPTSMIDSGPPSRLAIRRYGPLANSTE